MTARSIRTGRRRSVAAGGARSQIGGDVQHDDDHDQQQRRREDHRLGGLAVLALEAEVEDVEAQVHEAALGVHEGERAVDRQLRRELDGADEHQRRHLARAARHGEDHARHDARASRAAARCGGSSATCSRRRRSEPSRIEPRHGGERLLGRDDHDRQREQRQRERGPQEAARCRRSGWAAARRRSSWSIAAADDVAEEPRPKTPNTMLGTPARLLTAMRTALTSGPGLRVLAQVERGQHAEGHDQQRHDQRHHHGAEDRREDAALAVGLARLVGEELATSARGRRRACRPNAELVGRVGAHDVGQAAASFSCPSAVASTQLVARRSRASSASICAADRRRTRSSSSASTSRRSPPARCVALPASPRRGRARPRAASRRASSSSRVHVADRRASRAARRSSPALARPSSWCSLERAPDRSRRRWRTRLPSIENATRRRRRSGPTSSRSTTRAHSGCDLARRPRSRRPSGSASPVSSKFPVRSRRRRATPPALRSTRARRRGDSGGQRVEDVVGSGGNVSAARRPRPATTSSVDASRLARRGAARTWRSPWHDDQRQQADDHRERDASAPPVSQTIGSPCAKSDAARRRRGAAAVARPRRGAAAAATAAASQLVGPLAEAQAHDLGDGVDDEGHREQARAPRGTACGSACCPAPPRAARRRCSPRACGSR